VSPCASALPSPTPPAPSHQCFDFPTRSHGPRAHRFGGCSPLTPRGTLIRSPQLRSSDFEISLSSEERRLQTVIAPLTTVCLTPPRPIIWCKSPDGTSANQRCSDEGPLTLERSKT
jgi:hypothetical protein